ncbi:hypothetical protein ABT187_49045, partial [Streptomyces sp. NPDC001817]|uniref:hypothetical protein n=1 Tax=Streptomyces sp. NPDC001817 TaxID=3154398 RepID=UPI00331AE8DF
SPCGAEPTKPSPGRSTTRDADNKLSKLPCSTWDHTQYTPARTYTPDGYFTTRDTYQLHNRYQAFDTTPPNGTDPTGHLTEYLKKRHTVKTVLAGAAGVGMLSASVASMTGGDSLQDSSEQGLAGAGGALLAGTIGFKAASATLRTYESKHHRLASGASTKKQPGDVYVTNEDYRSEEQWEGDTTFYYVIPGNVQKFLSRKLDSRSTITVQRNKPEPSQNYVSIRPSKGDYKKGRVRALVTSPLPDSAPENVRKAASMGFYTLTHAHPDNEFTGDTMLVAPGSESSKRVMHSHGADMLVYEGSNKVDIQNLSKFYIEGLHREVARGEK